MDFQGWKGFILKKKLKGLKNKLKEWNKEQFGNLDHQLQIEKDELHSRDAKAESMALLDEEV